MRILIGLLVAIASILIAPAAASATEDVCLQQDIECYDVLDPEHPELEPQGPDEHEAGQVDCPDGQIGTITEGELVCPPPIVIVPDPEPELPPVEEEPVTEEPVVIDEPVVIEQPPAEHEMPGTITVTEPVAVAPVVVPAAPTPVATPRPVARPVASEPVAELAYTGTEHSTALLIGGSALVLLGVAALMLGRRRTR